jgi:hypothetical protein
MAILRDLRIGDRLAAKSAKRAQARAGRNCLHCGQAIYARRSTKEYCSPKCRSAAHQAAGGTRPKKVGLRPGQARILQALSRISEGGSLNRHQLAERAGVKEGWLPDYLG